MVHATCEGSLRVTWPEKTHEETREETRREHDENTTDPERTRDVSSRFDQIDLVADARANAPISLAPSETPQFITRLIDSVPTTERVVRDKHDYPTTAREMLLDRADQARAGRGGARTPSPPTSRSNARPPSARAEKRREDGNARFKEGDYTQAVVHYTSCLTIDVTNHVAYANRSACFLKGDFEKALARRTWMRGDGVLTLVSGPSAWRCTRSGGSRKPRRRWRRRSAWIPKTRRSRTR